ncbi:MAG: glucose 1-dehydrogenase [Chloroflexi bacterium]|nr:glucose 1-dehydrogenase [Chloroflexota bacterium]
MENNVLDRFSLEGKVALVTGGSRGIGRAIALDLAAAGADIALAARKPPDLEKTAAEISACGRTALAVPVNLRHLPEIENLVRKTLESFGRIDILVNNAGTNPFYGSVFDIQEKAWDVTMGLNLKATFFLSQRVAGVMRERGSGGVIVNIASEAGVRPMAGLGVYSMSKAGVVMLTQVLAQELGQYGIRVNAIAPGIVRTEFSQALWDNPVIRKSAEDSAALGRIAEPDEVAGAALFLASEASSYITGQTILLDGGHYAGIASLLRTLRPGE